MVNVLCHTNLDDYQMEEWPTVMVAKPSVGEYVRSESGKRLMIVAITHTQRRHHRFSADDELSATLLIELHKAKGF